VINDKSQGSVVSYLWCGGTLDYCKFTAEFSIREFLKIGQPVAKKLIA